MFRQPFLIRVLLWRFVIAIPLRILPTKVDCHDDGENRAHRERRDERRGGRDEMRRVFHRVQVTWNCSDEVASEIVHAQPNRAFGSST